MLAVLALGLAATTLRAQQADPGPPRAVTPMHRAWSVAAPDASMAWFTLLAELRLPGPGAFAFTAPVARAANESLARDLAGSREFEVLHFVPRYHPSADRAALAAGLRAAAGTPARAPTPRAVLLVAALSQSITTAANRARLPALASALERTSALAPPPDRLSLWQQRLDSLYIPALAPWLRVERLDAGRVIVTPSLGAEGRIFAGTTDRSDNIIAVGTFPSDPDPEAPLLAMVRELCFPAVTRAADASRDFDAADPGSARRASLAAVRCGAQLIEALLPSRTEAYRAFWLRRASEVGRDAARFDTAFPPDAALQPALAAALRRVAPPR